MYCVVPNAQKKPVTCDRCGKVIDLRQGDLVLRARYEFGLQEHTGSEIMRRLCSDCETGFLAWINQIKDEQEVIYQ